MPRKYFRRKSFRRYRRRRGARRVKPNIPLNRGVRSTGVPNLWKAKLKMYELGETTNSAAFTSMNYRANALQEPRSGVSVQPRYFDQFAALYDAYRVTHVTFRVTFCNSTSTDIPVLGAITWSSSGYSQTSIKELYELGKGPTTIVLPSQGARTLKLSMPLYKIAGLTRRQYLADDDNTSTVASIPASLPHVHVIWQSLDGSSLSSVKVSVESTWYAEFFAKKNIAAS